jgi:toxin ParE1/3/4
MRDNPSAARGFMAAVRQATLQIGEFPHAGRPRTELLPGRFRFLTLTRYPYLLLYDAGLTPPVIIRIMHAARDLPATLRSLQ